MRQPITVSLPKELVLKTSRFCKQHSLTLSEVAREALRSFLYHEQMEEARRRFTLHVERQGISSEEDLNKKLRD